MRPQFSRPFGARQSTAAGVDGERSIAEMWLGAGHPLVRLLGRSEIASEQLVSVTAVQAAGVVFLCGGRAFGLSLAIAAAIVQVALFCRVAALKSLRHNLCLELIIEGGASLPLPCIERVGRRLVDRRTLEQLARSVQEMVETAARPQARPGAPQPLADVRVIRAVASELREVAGLLRGGRPAVEGVALVEWLITSPATPLYGTEVELLRQELRRARYLLTAHATSERSHGS
jgi:hypothetical protein